SLSPSPDCMVKRWSEEPGAPCVPETGRLRYSRSVCWGGLLAQAAIDAQSAAIKTSRSVDLRVCMMFGFLRAARAEMPGDLGLYCVPYSQWEPAVSLSRRPAPLFLHRHRVVQRQPAAVRVHRLAGDVAGIVAGEEHG